MKKAKAAKKSAGKSATATKQPLVLKQPQSKQLAATQAGIFLHTDDAWSQAYFDPKDLHNLERELLG